MKEFTLKSNRRRQLERRAVELLRTEITRRRGKLLPRATDKADAG